MDTKQAAIAAANALGRAAAASLNRAASATTIFAPGCPMPADLRRAFDDPIAKAIAAYKPHPAMDGPTHPALDPKNAITKERI